MHDLQMSGGKIILHVYSNNLTRLCSMKLAVVPLLGKYKTQLYDDRTQTWLPSSPGIGMHVEVKDPGTRVILSRHYAEEGRFVFTSHLPGEHSICIGTNTSRWYGGSQLVCSTVCVLYIR